MWPGSMVRGGDVIAVRLRPGPEWRHLVADAWDRGATLFPVDHRSPEAEVAALLSRCRPTLIVDEAGARRLPDGLPAEGGLALIVATSGSGGKPALVELSRGAVEHAVRVSLGALGAGPTDGWLACLPLAHIGGLLVVLRAVLLDAPLVVQERINPASLGGPAGRTAFTAMVPTMLPRLLDGGADLARFRRILVGGSPLPAALQTRLRDSEVPAVLTYGQTQSCGGVVYDGAPLAGVQVSIAAGGEVELGGPTLMRGYRLEPARSARAFSAAGWLRTGDAGHLDAGGLLHIDGRLDDLIITGGEKVWPAEVEAILREHPGVADALVSGRADPEWGMRVVARVVPVDPATPPSLTELRDFVGGEIARYKAPAELVITPSLPRTALGKLRRRRV